MVRAGSPGRRLVFLLHGQMIDHAKSGVLAERLPIFDLGLTQAIRDLLAASTTYQRQSRLLSRNLGLGVRLALHRLLLMQRDGVLDVPPALQRLDEGGFEVERQPGEPPHERDDEGKAEERSQSQLIAPSCFTDRASMGWLVLMGRCLPVAFRAAYR